MARRRVAMEYLFPAVLIGIIVFVAIGVIANIVGNKCPRCKIKLVERSTGDANVTGDFYCPKCGYVDESWR